MQRMTAKIFGFLVLGLGIVGLLSGDRQLLGFLNTDITLDIARLALAALLLYAVYGTRDNGMVRTALMVLAFSYIGLGLIGMFNSEVFGLLPSKLSMFDKFFHLASGFFVLAIATKRSEEGSGRHAAV